MKKRYNDNSSTVNQGWKQADQNHLRMFDNASAGPEWQLLTEEDWEDENKEEREYFCAICKARLDYLNNLDMWYCQDCVQWYDTKIQDVPIKNLNESRVKVYPELDHYPTEDEDDVWLPFVQGIDLDHEEDYDQEGVELISSSLDNRIQHIKVKGDITKALSAQHQFEQICEDSNCANSGPLTQGDGTATALTPLQISTGEHGPTGPSGPQGPVGLTTDSLYIVEGEEAFSTVSNTFSTSTAECDNGDFVISGGFKFVFPGNELGNPFVTANEPTTTLDGWSATIINIDSNTMVGIVGIAVCLDAS